MGLDNGVIVRGVTRKELPHFMRYPSEKDYFKGKVEICYWRKCWGLRNSFIHNCFLSEPESSYYRMDIEKVDFLRALIVDYLKRPNKWDDSIWDFEEIAPHLRNQRWNLLLLHFWMKRHPEAEVYFYDSY